MAKKKKKKDDEKKKFEYSNEVIGKNGWCL